MTTRSSQLTAVADLRWRMFVNSLRTKRGKLELASRTVVTGTFALSGLGGFAIAAGLAWYFVSQNKAEFLALLLWPILFFWQIFPLIATAFTNNPDASDLLRFPLTYRSFFLIRLAYGFFDPASMLGSLGLAGILVGAGAARPLLLPWLLLVLLTFVLFNLVLMQTIFAWVERWLGQRRTREILGVLFILFIVSFQLIGPAVEHFDKRARSEIRRPAEIVARAQAVLPPGLATDAIARASHAEYLTALALLLLLAAMTTAVGFLMHLRLRAQFRGENLSEFATRPAVQGAQRLNLGWDLPGFSQPVAAVFEKEVRYIARSGPMLLTLIMPTLLLAVFRLGPMNPMRPSNFLARAPDFVFPGAAAYTLLVLTNLVYNSFGGDGGGIQFFYASPVTFRQILLGKNLSHAATLLAATALALIAVAYLYSVPRPAVSIATLAGLLFAAPLNFTAGNLLSIYAPKKRDFATFGRQNVSQTTVLWSLGVQIVIVVVGVTTFTIARIYQNLWIAALIFLGLALLSFPLHVIVLHRLDRIALERRETLIAELCRA